MFDVSQKALDKIHDIFEERDKSGAIRLMPISGGCAGAYLDLFFDEPKETDMRLDKGDIAFVMDKTLYEQAKPISIDYSANPIASGFRISSAFERADACGDCGCSC